MRKLRATIEKGEQRLTDDDGRRYRVVFVTDKGVRGVHFPGPLTHAEACTCKASLTPYPWRTDSLEEIATTDTTP